MSERRAKLSWPGEKAYGPTSPVVRAVHWIRDFLSAEPQPDIASDAAKSSGILAGTHLLHLIFGCGLLNGQGHHSAAVVLLRPLEDALDCFAAVTLVSGAAERWAGRALRPSEAARLWTAEKAGAFRLETGTLPEYRKYLREAFAGYSHCSYDLCLWDLFMNPKAVDAETGNQRGALEPNLRGHVIDRNAHAIDAHLTAHLIEFIGIIRLAYQNELQVRPVEDAKLTALETDINLIMEKHTAHRCQEVRVPPEIARLKR
jgi:hypothetical protein